MRSDAHSTEGGREDGSEIKRRALELCHEYLIPGRVEKLSAMGVPLVFGRRLGYDLWDLDGRRLIDLHLNGGTYSLGHRHPDLVAAMLEAVESLDIGNHHFASPAKGALAMRLAELTPGDLHYSVLASGGSEAIDVAIKSARHATGRRKIVGLAAGYHGRTGLSGAAGDDAAARYFHCDYPEEFAKVPFNDLEAMGVALEGGDVAAVLMETIPATQGFPVPEAGYLAGVKALCERHGALYVADEVQTGLGRTGKLWGVECYGVEPDILVTAKGLSGGLYPIAATVLTKKVGGWLSENGWGHVSTFGGAEIGCRVALEVLDLCNRPETLHNARRVGEYLENGFAAIAGREPYLKGIRRKGVVMGLELDHPDGGIHMMKALYEQGIWAIFAAFDSSVLQCKPGLLLEERQCGEILDRFEAAIGRAKDEQGRAGGRIMPE